MLPASNDKDDTFKRRFSDFGAAGSSGVGTGVELLMGMRRSSLTNAALAAASATLTQKPFSSYSASTTSSTHNGDEEDKQAQEFADAITEIQQYSLSSDHIRASLRQSFVNPPRRRRSSVLNGNDSASAVSSSHASGSVITGKRRSRVDMASAVAEVMQFYNDLHADSDDEDGTVERPRPFIDSLVENPGNGLLQPEILAEQLEDPELQDDRPTKRHVGSVNATLSCTNTSSGQDRASSINSSTVQLLERRKSFSGYDNLAHKDTQNEPLMKQEPLIQNSIDTTESFSMRKQSLRDSLILSSMAIPRLSTSSTLAMSTAAAALAASAVAESNDRRLSQQYQTIPASMHQDDTMKDNQNKQRKMRRRVEFSISNIALEASMATASRMELLMKDRLASRAFRANVSHLDDSVQPTMTEIHPERLESPSNTSENLQTVRRRRSLSFTSNVNVANTFSAAVSEGAHYNTVFCNVNEYEHDRIDPSEDLMGLSRARRSRGILSIPDVQLLDRLSHATLEEGIDQWFIQDGDGEDLNQSLGIPVNHVHVPEVVMNQGNKNYNSSIQVDELNNNASFSDYDSISDDDLQEGATNEFYSDFKGNSAFDHLAYLPALFHGHQDKSLSEGFDHVPHTAGILDSRILGSSTFTQLAQSNSVNNVGDYNYDDDNHGRCPAVDDKEVDENSMSSFDGKVSHVSAWYPQTDKELNISLVIFRAATNDDRIIKNLLQNYKNLTRLCLDSSNGENGGEVALHVAARCGCLHAIRMILAADKDSALIRNNVGNVALHNAVKIGNFAAVSALCGQNALSAHIQNEEGCLPLHEAVSISAHHQDAPQITAVLLAAFPKAACIATDEGLLPVHLAAMSGFCAGLRTIMAYDFDTIYSKELTELMLPLDFAVDGLRSEYGESYDSENILSVVQQQNIPEKMSSTNLKSNFPSCIEILLMSSLNKSPVLAPRDEIFLPLHGTVVSCPLLRTWKTLFDIYGQEHQADLDVNGQNPLHYFCARAFDDELDITLLKDVFMRWPEWFEQQDKNGLLPLHLALLDSRRPFHLIDSILGCKPSTISIMVAPWSKRLLLRGLLPFQLAAISDYSIDVIYILLRTDPATIK